MVVVRVGPVLAGILTVALMGCWVGFERSWLGFLAGVVTHEPLPVSCRAGGS